MELLLEKYIPGAKILNRQSIQESEFRVVEKLTVHLNESVQSFVYKSTTEYEVRVMLFLEKYKNLPLAKMHGCGTNFFFTEYIEHYELKHGFQFSPEFVYAIAEIHDSIRVNDDDLILKLSMDELNDKAIELLELIRRKDLNQFLKSEYVNKLNVIVRALLPYLPQILDPRLQTFIHFDLHYKNILINGRNELKFIDWDCARIGNPMLDISYLLQWGELTDLYYNLRKTKGTLMLSKDEFYYQYKLCRLEKLLESITFFLQEALNPNKQDISKIFNRMRRVWIQNRINEMNELILSL